MKVIENPYVSVQVTSRGDVELQIGEAEPGKPRYTHLSPSQSRLVAYALLTAAEQVIGPQSK